MTNEKLFEALGDINERHILEAKVPKTKKPYTWVKWGLLTACLCLVIKIGLIYIPWPNHNGNGGFGDSGSELLASHREDFSPEIDDAILAQFENPDKVFWIEKGKYINYYQTPLDMSTLLHKGIFEAFSTVVCTSATLGIAILQSLTFGIIGFLVSRYILATKLNLE